MRRLLNSSTQYLLVLLLVSGCFAPVSDRPPAPCPKKQPIVLPVGASFNPFLGWSRIAYTGNLIWIDGFEGPVDRNTLIGRAAFAPVQLPLGSPSARWTVSDAIAIYKRIGKSASRDSAIILLDEVDSAGDAVLHAELEFPSGDNRFPFAPACTHTRGSLACLVGDVDTRSYWDAGVAPAPRFFFATPAGVQSEIEWASTRFEGIYSVQSVGDEVRILSRTSQDVAGALLLLDAQQRRLTLGRDLTAFDSCAWGADTQLYCLDRVEHSVVRVSIHSAVDDELVATLPFVADAIVFALDRKTFVLVQKVNMGARILMANQDTLLREFEVGEWFRVGEIAIGVSAFVSQELDGGVYLQELCVEEK